MKRKIKLCNECIDMLSDHMPYVYPDKTPMRREDLIIEEVNVEDCDNHNDNINRTPIWVDDSDPLLTNLYLSVVKFEMDTITKQVCNFKHLHEGIPNYETANLLAKYEMTLKRDDELIAILPAWAEYRIEA